MKKTLFEIVDDILNDLDADKVNSITDTVESEQVAQIVQTCYYEMLGNRNWPHTRKLVQFNALGDLSKPNYLRAPEEMKELVFFRYDCQKLGDTIPDLQDIKYKEPEEFLRMLSKRSGDNLDQVVDFSGSTLLIFNDKHPQYWTSFDDEYVVTDSYDSAVDDTLKQSKTQCLAYIIPSWSHVDTFVPDLPIEAFPALIEEAKSTAFIALKQVANQKAEQKSNRQQRWLSRKAWTLDGGIKYENYGRKSRK